ncbi:MULTISPECIES: HPr family phosphocarrier protein [unclassified Peribacillus]|uniref:HPr family phosphocarrier protein n=1 Tax=unclassified Peribacillus TaxID=2675266 RepID=UPI001F4D7FBA|nr:MULTISPECIES: HPr family phosphocarrier protein [unclassified Peribacillus]MCK1986046.1 HPr family phosphocarrier protein [Peribacillus sp. Aquil_B1]MCK2011344.1 HPr family phosphocarrier protein [Peribacillus sp. Aquil_B8]
MLNKIYSITDSAGLHARPSSLLVKTVTPFESDVILEYAGRQINLKSIIAVMSLGIPKEATIKIIANGSDAEKVIAHIDGVMENENLGIWRQTQISK